MSVKASERRVGLRDVQKRDVEVSEGVRERRARLRDIKKGAEVSGGVRRESWAERSQKGSQVSELIREERWGHTNSPRETAQGQYIFRLPIESCIP